MTYTILLKEHPLYGFVEVAPLGFIHAGSLALAVCPGKRRFSLPLVAVRFTFRPRLYLASIHYQLLSDYDDSPHSSQGGAKRTTRLNNRTRIEA